MDNTGVNWPFYVKTVEDQSLILIRSTLSNSWMNAQHWTLDEAEDLANHLLATVAEARRNSPEVRELTNVLEESGAFNECTGMTISDLAQHLVKLGYRKD